MDVEDKDGKYQNHMFSEEMKVKTRTYSKVLNGQPTSLMKHDISHVKDRDEGKDRNDNIDPRVERWDECKDQRIWIHVHTC